MPLLCRKLRGQKRLHQLLRHLRSDDARAQAEDVHRVVFHALMGGVGVVANTRVNARNLVRGDARTHPGAAEQHPAFCLPGEDGLADLFGVVGVVHAVGVMRAEVEGFMPGGADGFDEELFEGEAAVVGGDGDDHGRSFSNTKGTEIFTKITKEKIIGYF